MIVALTENNMALEVTGDVSDRTCLRRFSNGDHDAFYTIFRKYEQPLIRYLYGFTSDAELSKDICQETFLRLINKPPLFFFGDSIKPWLFKVARNKAIDVIRSRKTKVLTEAEHRLHVESYVEHPSSFQGDDDEIMKLRSSLKDIPEAYREVVSLHIYGKLTFNEISKLLGIPLGTALWRMQKALSLLREEMEKRK